MNNQQILDNAPEGATHIDNNGYYLKAGKSGFMEPSDCGLDWDYDYANHTEVRSLADITRIVELEKERVSLLSCLLDISNECIGEIAMNYKLDAQMIGESIYVATGLSNPELAKALKEQGE